LQSPGLLLARATQIAVYNALIVEYMHIGQTTISLAFVTAEPAMRVGRGSNLVAIYCQILPSAKGLSMSTKET
jgi:hypothetical protein